MERGKRNISSLATLHAHTAQLWLRSRDPTATLRDLALLDDKLQGIALANQLKSPEQEANAALCEAAEAAQGETNR